MGGKLYLDKTIKRLRKEEIISGSEIGKFFAPGAI